MSAFFCCKWLPFELCQDISRIIIGIQIFILKYRIGIQIIAKDTNFVYNKLTIIKYYDYKNIVQSIIDLSIYEKRYGPSGINNFIGILGYIKTLIPHATIYEILERMEHHNGEFPELLSPEYGMHGNDEEILIKKSFEINNELFVSVKNKFGNINKNNLLAASLFIMYNKSNILL